MYHPSRGGVRGGQDQFDWEDVKADKHRESYLGEFGFSKDNAPINVNPVGGGVRARGGDLIEEQKFWSISQGWGSIRSSNVVKNPHPDTSFQKHKLKSE